MGIRLNSADGVRAAVAVHHGIEAHDVVLVVHRSIPTTSSGKIQRGQCREQFRDRRLTVVADWRLTTSAGRHPEMHHASKRDLNATLGRPCTHALYLIF